MKRLENETFPIYTPNLVNICVDEEMNGEMAGRIYHCYDKQAWEFSSVIKLIEKLEYFYDQISFPQASTESRSFSRKEIKKKDTLYKEETSANVAAQRGRKGSFLIHVQYRQNSSWQGEIEWLERDSMYRFYSELEVLKIITNALMEGTLQ